VDFVNENGRNPEVIPDYYEVPAGGKQQAEPHQLTICKHKLAATAGSTTGQRSGEFAEGVLQAKKMQTPNDHAQICTGFSTFGERFGNSSRRERRIVQEQ